MVAIARVVGEPMPKGSMHCIGPRKCRSCDATVVHNLQPDDKSGKGKDWRQRLHAAGKTLRQRAGFTYEGPVRVDAVFIMPRPKAAGKRLFPHVRPDLDKLSRMLLDALTVAKVWTDDSLVVELRVRKIYPDAKHADPGVIVRVQLADGVDTLPLVEVPS